MENNVNSGVRTVGHINIDIYSCITKDIVSDEVIITDERIEHIKKRHSGQFEVIAPYLQSAIQDPDFILEDTLNTGLILKTVSDMQFQIVLRIKTSMDNPNFKNSILSTWIISENRRKNYLRNKNILYKRE